MNTSFLYLYIVFSLHLFSQYLYYLLSSVLPAIWFERTHPHGSRPHIPWSADMLTRGDFRDQRRKIRSVSFLFNSDSISFILLLSLVLYVDIILYLYLSLCVVYSHPLSLVSLPLSLNLAHTQTQTHNYSPTLSQYLTHPFTGHLFVALFIFISTSVMRSVLHQLPGITIVSLSLRKEPTGRRWVTVVSLQQQWKDSEQWEMKYIQFNLN